jgi:hypothetical protein
MDGVDLFPRVTQRRRIIRRGEDNQEEIAWETRLVRTSEEGPEGHRTPEENEALRRRDEFVRYHTQTKLDISQMLDLDPTRWSGGEKEDVRDETMQIEGGQMEEENGRWKPPSCVCITPCP